MALGIIEHDDQPDPLKALIPRLLKMESVECYQIMESTLMLISQMGRKDLVKYLTTMMIVLRHLQKSNLDNEILVALQDISKWWD